MKASENNLWQAVVNRDTSRQSDFLFGVTTTGIYCRPGCPSPLPKREHIRFFKTWQAAETEGFRPCKRCNPRGAHPQAQSIQYVIHACRLIETSQSEPSLDELAGAVGLSPSQFHRVFKKVTGITPKAYALEVRADRVRENLQEDATITQTVADAGYASSSRFYERSQKTLGMQPSHYKNGATGLTIRYAIVNTFLGPTLIAATERGICHIEFGDSANALRDRLETIFPQARLVGDDPAFNASIIQVIDFIESPGDRFPLPLDIQGTAFQRRVWTALQDIQPGKILSYKDIAHQIGHPKSARAVGNACAVNRLAVAVPCHRAIRTDGGLGGYRWGLKRKIALLARESDK